MCGVAETWKWRFVHILQKRSATNIKDKSTVISIFQDQELALMAARQYFIEYGSEISEEGLQGVLPSYIPTDRRLDQDWMKMWRRLVIKAHRRLFGNETGRENAIDQVKLDVINYAKRNWPMAFSRYAPQYDTRAHAHARLHNTPTRSSSQPDRPIEAHYHENIY